jgi:hypothetical protein
MLVKDLGAGITVQDVVAETSGGSTGGAWHGQIPDESRERDHGRQIIHATQTIKRNYQGSEWH